MPYNSRGHHLSAPFFIEVSSIVLTFSGSRPSFPCLSQELQMGKPAAMASSKFSNTLIPRPRRSSFWIILSTAATALISFQKKAIWKLPAKIEIMESITLIASGTRFTTVTCRLPGSICQLLLAMQKASYTPCIILSSW